MLVKTNSVILALGIILTVFCGNVYAQKTVYKWVDEDGVVHFSEEPPSESPDVQVKTLTTDPAPTSVSPAQATVKPPSTAAAAEVERPPARPPIPQDPPVEKIDITKMSLAELDRRCEAARQAKIAPLKAAEIANCIQAGTGDQDWCETFWADYGAPRRMKSGGLTPPMFHDLPECVEAFEENNRRGLYPDD